MTGQEKFTAATVNLWIEMPRLTSSQYTDREAVMAALEMALEHIWEYKGGPKK